MFLNVNVFTFSIIVHNVFPAIFYLYNCGYSAFCFSCKLFAVFFSEQCLLYHHLQLKLIYLGLFINF